jgi:hypothetical protein
MKEYASKVVEVTEHHAEEIARQWAKAVRTNPKTPSYRDIPEEKAIRQAVNFYTNFREMFFAENPYEAARQFTVPYAEKRYREGIPLSEAVYALTLMRRHMWLYAEFQSLFITALERQQAVESLNRTILMFDYVVYVMDETYQNLIRRGIGKELGAVKTLMGGADRKAEASKAVIMAVLLAACLVATYYSHAVLRLEAVFTHLFYIPIIMASIWWRKRGIIVPVFLSVILIGSHLLFIPDYPYLGDVVRATMFLVIGLVVSLLTEGVERAEIIYGQQRV